MAAVLLWKRPLLFYRTGTKEDKQTVWQLHDDGLKKHPT